MEERKRENTAGSTVGDYTEEVTKERELAAAAADDDDKKRGEKKSEVIR